MAGETKDSESPGSQASGSAGAASDVNEFIAQGAKGSSVEEKTQPERKSGPAEEKKQEHKPQHDLFTETKSSEARLVPSPEAKWKGQSKNANQQREKRKSERSEYSGLKGQAINIYDNHYRKLLIIPAAVIIAAVVVLLLSYSNTGSFFKKDISLSGGVSVIAVTDFADEAGLESELLNQFPDADVSVRSVTQLGRSTGVVVEAAMQSEKDIDVLLDSLSAKLGIAKSEFSVQKVGASLGSSFFAQLTRGMIFAFIFMALAVFVYFKITSGKWLWLPGLFVIWTAFVDILCTLAVVSITGMHLSAAGLAAFLMLIGYSVDTDILLTVRALKGTEARLNERVRSAVRTGVLMSLTAFVAVTAGYFFAEAETIKQIMFILSAGMIFDIIHTWLTNAGLLRWYLEKKGMV